LLVKLGTGGGIASTGYASTGARLAAAGTTVDSSTAGFLINSTSAADAVSGTLVISAVDPTNYIYAADHTVKDGTTAVMTGAGNVTLGNLMTQLSITTVSGTANFDAGTINVLYE
jgi:hypothetical protein